MRAKLKEVVSEPNGTAKGEFDESVVDKVLALLEHKLLPTEPAAVRQILMQPAKGKSCQYDPGAMTAEDARLAFDSFAKRFPDVAKIRIESTMTPAPTRQTQQSASPSDYFRRFPDARRIAGLASGKVDVLDKPKNQTRRTAQTARNSRSRSRRLGRGEDRQ